MDDINDFFDFSKNFERKTVPRGCVSGTVATTVIPAEDSKHLMKREYVGTEYSKDVAEMERLKLEKLDLNGDHDQSRYGASCSVVASSCMDDLESLSDSDDDDERDNDNVPSRPNRVDDAIYDRYPFDLRRDENLPIHDKREEIVNTIRANPVVVPQYIIDDAYTRREYCKIICTQPRRIAAISIARRVCQERKWPEGSIVGYQVGLHANISEDTRIVYCTTGVLLQKLIHEKSLGNYTHIILDEVHERDQEMDFLLIVIRRFLSTNSKRCKIILMSATINSVEFSNYFKIKREPAPILKADSRRLFQVKDFYLDDLGRINNTNVEIDVTEPGISPEMYRLVLKLIIVIDNIEKQEVALSLNSQTNAANSTSILIFLPGINEIEQMCKRLELLNNSEENTPKLSPIRLHSLISPDEQIKVFHQAPLGYRKVILATNIAESSITVPDVKYVIDFCLTKALVTDTASNFTSLQLQWASKANCKQRAGRAGRVMNGRVYRLVPRYYYENYMDEFSIPEMLRCPLENVVLKAKLLDMGPPPDILGLAMSPPNLSDIHNTILTLKEVGALYTTVNGVYSVQDGDISYMGRIMASLPLNIRLSRLIVLGYIFSVLEDAIIIAAGLSVRSIFRYHGSTPQSDCDAYIQKLLWADGSGSDLFAILKSYKVWKSMREQNSLREEEGEHAWAKRFYINLRTIKEMHLLVQELKERLANLNFKEQTTYQRVHWMDREKTIILKIIIAGAFYPNYFTRTSLNDTERDRKMYHVLNGNDPCRTVFFTNFNNKHVGELYTRSIKDIFKDVRIPAKDIEVRFQSGSEKVFVTFKKNLEDEYDDSTYRLTVPGKVRAEVYKAVRMRLSKMKTIINVMDVNMGIKYAEELGIVSVKDGEWQLVRDSLKHADLIVLPSIFQKKLRGQITHIENCSKFFFLPASESERLRDIHDALNDPRELKAGVFDSPAAVSKGMLLSAPLDDKYRRAKLFLMLAPYNFKYFSLIMAALALLTLKTCAVILLNLLPYPKYLPRIFECRLAMVQPSTVRSPNGKWSDDANELLQKCANAGSVELEVFSVVDAVANVFIRVDHTTFNDILVEKQYARKCDENYLSKIDYDVRLRKQSLSSRYLDEDHMRQNEEYIRSNQLSADFDIPSPPKQLCNKLIKLRGPYSPLETKIFSAVRVGEWKCVQIERESVNSVLLDTDPQDVHERLVVAADVTETQTGETIIARSTTLMPNIHGFGALMTMMFCPTMQIKRNKERTKYVAILAGLGYDEHTYKPLYGEHDIVLNLDVEIEKEDFEMINQLRYCMDAMLFTDHGDERPNILPSQMADLQAKIKEIIIRLLSKNRKYIETHCDENDNVWQYHEPTEILETVCILGERTIFPMLSALRLYDEKYDRIQALLRHCSELHKLRQFDGSIQPVTCLLCNQPLENVAQLRIHLISQLHRDREQQIHFKPSKK
ncbi:putative ATP-dependent RNA helicase spindle-E [Lucilia cuprina]|nr:putative ATP-dependent RNA helicase spindle-E [Lucilia cuprina]KAI8129775.1 putative ATP-dependent RNA helicase spindle-E [Lucilia cuprina]